MSGQNSLTIEFIGCGDAFGSGGRFNTCFHVKGDEVDFLIDCGASSLIALKRRQVDLNAIDTVLVTHFHADHFAGLPFIMLDAQFFSKRTTPLTVAGPVGIEERYRRLSEAMFPGSSATVTRFPLRFVELKAGTNRELGRMNVETFEVNHGHEGGPFLGYRVEVGGRMIAYTGDTEWMESLIALGRNADLLIAEAYFHDKKVPLHLDYVTLAENLGRVKPRKVVLTHMSADMLNRDIPPPIQLAHDGLQIRV
ncbi:MBL fold metallo-hydrolase [Shinella sp.]|uniref:MBL fold metallo-hydrolase n=1 Tax=Shinella sp. TaxID=1870904 RepID=UPI002586FAB7|nr:MBL fold metallo-hydrolase [Shinella sp.]MCW5711971.1 MBL fold metallo-hydrolase [Shinella sp.]